MASELIAHSGLPPHGLLTQSPFTAGSRNNKRILLIIFHCFIALTFRDRTRRKTVNQTILNNGFRQENGFYLEHKPLAMLLDKAYIVQREEQEL